jgi:short-subunit dehydrogenase
MNKTVVISGGSQGIGKSLIKFFLSKGFTVFACARNQQGLSALEKEMSSSNLHVFRADVSKKQEVLHFADWVKQQTQTLDVLINNAGYFEPGQIQSEKEGVLERQIETNLYSAYHLTRALLPIIPSNAGHIFNMCSVASIMPYIDGGSYCISKFALLGFSKVLREELKAQKIKVTSILPGATLTNSWAGVNLPKERFIDADELAKSIYAAYDLGPSTVIEELLVRPMEGDI